MGYRLYMLMDVGDNAFKKEAPAAKQRVQQLVEIRKQLKLKFKKSSIADKEIL
jgi:hypothetical protein